NPRHEILRVYVERWSKAENGVVESWVGLEAETLAINRGEALRRGDDFLVNGRLYHQKADGRLYPVDGPGVHQLQRMEYTVLGYYNQFGLNEQTERLLDRMTVVLADREAARQAWRAEYGGR